MKLCCINYQPVSLYYEQGWSKERLAKYYNPDWIAEPCFIFAYNDHDWDISRTVRVIGWKTPEELLEKVESFAPDIIRCYEANQPFATFTLRIAKKLGVPSYLSLHDSRKVQIYDPELADYSVITAYNQALADRASEFFDREIEVQRNGVPANVFKIKTAYIPDWRLSSANFRIFTIGRDDPVKNIPAMTKAVQLLADTWSDYRIAHVLAGPGLENIKNIDRNLTQIGVGKTAQNVIVGFLNWANVFLQVQQVPDIGVAHMEAWMCGCPVMLAGDNNSESTKIVTPKLGTVIPMDKMEDELFIADELGTLLSRKFDREKIRAWAVDNFGVIKQQAQEAKRYRKLKDVTVVAEDLELPVKQSINSVPTSAPATSTIKKEIEIVPITPEHKDQWNHIAKHSPDAWLYHTYEWQKLLNIGWDAGVYSIGITRGDQFLATLPLNVMPGSVLLDSGFGHGGIAFDHTLVPELEERQEIFKAVLEYVFEIMKEIGINSFRVVLPPLSDNMKSNFHDLLIPNGFNDISNITYIIPLVNLQTMDAVRERYHKNMRYDIRKASKNKDLTIRRARSEADVKLYYKMHEETYKRTGVKPHPYGYFEQIWQLFCYPDYNKIFICYENETAIAADNIAFFKGRAYYSTGCSTQRGLELNANKMLQDHAINNALMNGIEFYEVGEGFENVEKTDKRYGLDMFKRRFGGEIVRYHKGIITI